MCPLYLWSYVYILSWFIPKLACDAWWEQMPFDPLAIMGHGIKGWYEKGTYLVIGVEERLSNDDILSPSGSKDNHLGNIVRCEGVAATDNSVRINVTQ
jgi:hypothetical protein